QRLAQPPLVVGDQMRGGGQNMRGRAVVALEPDDARAGKVVLEAQDVVHLGAPPAIDGLVVVAHAADVLDSRSYDCAFLLKLARSLSARGWHAKRAGGGMVGSGGRFMRNPFSRLAGVAVLCRLASLYQKGRAGRLSAARRALSQ